MNLTIAYLTSRKEPRIEWFFDSLANQIESDDKITIIVVDYFHDQEGRVGDVASKFAKAFVAWSDVRLQHVNPKNSQWQGKFQITKEPWWDKSAYHNAAIILCESPHIAFVDDRSVLGRDWVKSVHRAIVGEFAVCGSYEKHSGLIVENGVVKGSQEVLGVDTRSPGLRPFDSWYGGSCALPLEWCLKVNGYDEPLCGSAGTEDSMFGVTLRNSGFPIFYDSEMRLIEDRTPSEIDGALKRADKNPHLGRKAKSWSIVRAFHGRTTSTNEYDIRNMRDRVLLNGEKLEDIPPIIQERDWYDMQPTREME